MKKEVDIHEDKKQVIVKKQIKPDLYEPFGYKVTPYSLNRDFLALSSTCKKLRGLTLEEREKREKEAASALLLAIVQGNENEAEKRLKEGPGLLKCALGEAKDYSGRDIKKLTPFQAALCSGDVEMVEMMKTYFDKLKNGKEEMEKQFKEIFPEGIDPHVKKQEKDVFDFSEILNAIKNAGNNEVTAALDKKFDKKSSLHQALDKFRKAFTDKSLSETVFNPTHLLKAFKMYNTEFDNFNNLDKRDLFWRQVIGYVQRYLPACYLQAFAQGIYGIVERNKKLGRSFDFSYGGGSIAPLGADARLGYDFAVGARWASGALRMRLYVQNYVSAKTSSLEKLLSQFNDQNRTWSVINSLK
jgi:hypothetical protein